MNANLFCAEAEENILFAQNILQNNFTIFPSEIDNLKVHTIYYILYTQDYSSV